MEESYVFKIKDDDADYANFTYGGSPLHGFLIQQVTQQVIQQIIQLFLSFLGGGEGLLYDFSRPKSDLYNI